jgi:hypothetical protein
MEIDNKYEGKQAHKPQEEIEILMSSVWNLLAIVEVDMDKKQRSRDWEDLIKTYTNLHGRSYTVVPTGIGDYTIDVKKYTRETLGTIKEYLSILQQIGLYELRVSVLDL